MLCYVARQCHAVLRYRRKRMDFSLGNGHGSTELWNVRWGKDDMVFEVRLLEGKVYTRAHCELKRKEEFGLFPL